MKKGRLKAFQTAFELYRLFRQHKKFDQYVFKDKTEHAQTQHQKQNKGAEFAGFRFFAQMPNDKTQKNNQNGQADF